jgi:hypothetical protein
MRKPRPERSLQELGESVMDLVGRVAGRRVTQVLEFVYEDQIKPLEVENARLRALLEQHGVKP